MKVNLNFNVQAGLLTASFTSIDPLTGQAPTAAFTGFLPPDNSSGVGEGFVQYTVQPKAGLASGSSISAQASVVFDTNPALQTPTVVNKIHTTSPISSVNPLPGTQSSPSLAVSWSGSDPTGPGIASYNIFVSDNGGAVTPWLTGTTQTSATYNGQIGHTYYFYSMATDALGLVQPTAAGAQASTTVTLSPPPSPPPLHRRRRRLRRLSPRHGAGRPDYRQRHARSRLPEHPSGEIARSASRPEPGRCGHRAGRQRTVDQLLYHRHHLPQ